MVSGRGMLLSGAAAVLASGCQRLPDVTYETEHAEIGTFFDAPLCAGNLAHIDEMIEDLGVALDSPLDLKHRIYWGVEGVADFCDFDEFGFEADGCHTSRADRSFVTLSSLVHELVHAVGQRVATMDPFFEEGAAYALPGHIILDPEHLGLLPSTFVGRSYEEYLDKDAASAVATHFVRFLIEEHGLAPLNELRRRAHYGSSRDRILEVFDDIYGMSLADLETSWSLRAPLAYNTIIEHPLPVEQWDGDALTVQRTLACDDVATWGPLESGPVSTDFHEQ